MTTPDTSRAALRAHQKAEINASILSLLAEAGDDGLTCDDIEVLLDLGHQTASANISHMMNGTLNTWIRIERTGRQAPTRTGRKAHVLRLMDVPQPPQPQSKTRAGVLA